MITVKVPTTSANLGPGFDCLGLALGLYNYISFEESGEGISISGCNEKFCNEENLAYKAYITTLTYKKAGIPAGLKINIRSEIPVSRGLGSSASLIVAGIAAADNIHNFGLSNEEKLLIANELEGHPDNAAPAIYGGLTAATVRDGQPIVVKYDVCKDIKFATLIPDFETSTEMARKLLPEDIKRTDAVYTVGCLGLLLKALETGDEKALAAALDDRLHQPYRKQLIPGFDDIKALAIEKGAQGLLISGSGSTLLAVGCSDDFEEKMEEALKSIPGNWIVKMPEVDQNGAAQLSYPKVDGQAHCKDYWDACREKEMCRI